MPPAAWLALGLLLLGSRSLALLPLAGAAWLAAFAALSIGERAAIPASGAGYYAITATIALSLTLPLLIDRLCVDRLRAWPLLATLVLPLALTAVEFGRSRLSPNGTWGVIAYSQYGVMPLMQVAAVTGIWGITFLVAWVASTADLAWRAGFDASVARAGLACAVTVGVVVAGGTIRLATAPTDRAALRVATLHRPAGIFAPGEMTQITAGTIAEDRRAEVARTLARLHDAFLNDSRREARAGSRLIVWPEQNLLVLAEDEAAFLAQAREVAAREHVYLAMGMGTIHLGQAHPFENKLVLIDPSGTIAVSYRKTHPASSWEASIMQPGDGHVPIVATVVGRMAGAICHDGAFPEFIRQAAAGHADLLILPVNEWRAIADVHFRMHAFRAIETGVPIVRAAASGLSAVFDAWGRVIGVADDFAPGDRTLVAQVPIGGTTTVYAWIGDLFAWLCVAGLAATLVLAATRPA